MLVRLYMSGQGFLYGLQLPVSPFPTPAQYTGAVCERPYRLRVLRADPTPDESSASLQLFASAPPTCSWIGGGQKNQCTYPRQEPIRPPKFLAFLSTHATLFVDPDRPSESSPKCPLCVGFWYRYTIATCIILGNEAVSRLQGVRSPLWPMWFPVYASVISFGFCLLHNCNTRYGWLVRPYPAGTFTLQETPSFAWRTTALS